MTWIAHTVSGISYEVDEDAAEEVLGGARRFVEGVARKTISVDHDPEFRKAHIAVAHVIALEEAE